MGEDVVSHTLHIHWLVGLTGALGSPVMQDLSGRRHVGPNWGLSKA